MMTNQPASVTRRHFLNTLTATSVLLPLGFGSASCQEPAQAGRGQWRPQLALSSLIYAQLGLEDLCKKAVELGFKGIDLWGPSMCNHLVLAEKMGAKKFKALLKSHQLEIVSYTTYSAAGRSGAFLPYAKFIEQMGGGIVVRESAYGSFPDATLEASMKQFFINLKPEIKAARKHNIRLAIENHGGALLSSAKSFDVFCKLNPDAKVVGIGLAGAHLQPSQVDVPKTIELCGDQLLFFYAWQHGHGLDQLPGHGKTDMTPWLQSLAKIKYQGWIVPFQHGVVGESVKPAMIKARTYLEQIEIK